MKQILPVEYVEVKGRKYVLFKNDCGVTDMTRRGGIYEYYIFDYIRKHIPVEGKTIIDIGANFGFHSLEFADLVGESGNIFSFEPQRLVYYQLCANIILNGHHNIFAHNIALGCEQGKTIIEVPDYYSETTINIGDVHVSSESSPCRGAPIEMKKLDWFGFDNVAVIKLDVQGFEPFVLDGAIDTIQKNCPHIFVEIEPPQLERYGFTPDDVARRLSDLGYSLKKVIDAPHLVDYIASPQ